MHEDLHAYRYKVINLARSQERRAHMTRELARALIADQADFFCAIEGQDCGARRDCGAARRARYVHRRALSYGEIACLAPAHAPCGRRCAQMRRMRFMWCWKMMPVLRPKWMRLCVIWCARPRTTILCACKLRSMCQRASRACTRWQRGAP